MNDSWSYEKQKRFDSGHRRWHFVIHDVPTPDLAYENEPYELYFRSDDRAEFGLLRFERRKDNPYRDYEALVTKIMNDPTFRHSLLAPETEALSNRNWK